MQDHQQVERKRRPTQGLSRSGETPKNQGLPDTSTPVPHLASHLFQLLGPTQASGHCSQQLPTKPHGAHNEPQQEQEDVK